MNELPEIVRRFNTDAAYRSDPGFNWSRLKAGIEGGMYEGSHTSMAHLRKVLFEPRPRVDKPAFAFGRLVHLLALEPHLADTTYLVSEETDRRRKAYKEDKVKAEEQGLEFDRAYEVATAVHSNPLFAAQFPGSTVEIGMAVQDPLHGLRLKGKYDMLTGDGVMVDVKTTDSLRRRDIERTIAQYNYHVQMALYWRILRLAWPEYAEFPTAMAWLFVCKSAPHETVWVHASEGMVDAAVHLCDDLLARVAHAASTDSWPALHPNGQMVAELPSWAMPDTSTISPLPPTLLDVSKSL